MREVGRQESLGVSRMVAWLVPVVGVLTSVWAPAHGQEVRPVLGEEIRVSSPSIERPLVEPMLAAHPTDPDRLVGASIRTFHDRIWGPGQDCVSFRSDDGGTSWALTPFPVFRCGDPWVAFGPDGAAWAVMIARMAEGEDRGLRIFRLPPDAEGHEWEHVASLAYGDHPTLTVDTTTGPGRGSVYVVANRSRTLEETVQHYGSVVWRRGPGSDSFQEASFFHASNLNVNPDNPVVLPGGKLLVPFTDFMRNVDDFRGAGRLKYRRTWVSHSTDAEADFLPPAMVSEFCGAGFGILAGGRAAPGPHVFHICNSQGSRTVLLHRSADGGMRWEDPRPLAAEGPEDSRGAPGLAAARNGDVLVAWQDRTVTEDSDCQRVVFSGSVDDGRTFTNPASLSLDPSCPLNPENLAPGARWESGSDYGAVTLGADGHFHVVWADARHGAYALYTRSVRLEVDGPRPPPPCTPALGARIGSLVDDARRDLGIEVREVLEGPAREAGLRTGDVILTLNGRDPRESDEPGRVHSIFIRWWKTLRCEGTAVLEIERHGEPRTIEIPLRG